MRQKISAVLVAGAATAATAAAAVTMDASPTAAAIVTPAGALPSGPCALPGRTDDVAESATTPAGYARSHGTVRALTLFIDFPDARATITPRARFAEFFPAATRFFRASSYGRLDYRPVPLLKWIRMSRPLAAYRIEREATFDARSKTGYHAISREIVRAVDDAVDFRAYDVINVLAAPNAGPPAARKVLSVTFSGGDMGLPTADGVPFRNASFIWSRQSGDGAYRVLNHENGHAFGLPDLYYTDGRRSVTPVGHWDPMDEDWGPRSDFLGWHKWKLGWLAPGQVHCAPRRGTPAEHTLTPAPAPRGTKIVVIPTSARTALVAEARTRGPLDPTLCRPGVLVYRVTTHVTSGRGPLRVVDATPHSGGCFTADKYVEPELTDATLRPGATYTDRRSGAAVTVLGENRDGTYRIRATPAQSG
ncbi:M6 family metalloprotease domain-containing protein [Streptomyces sp. NPDC101150]|uniref:M6 family metalloprotease domain-containing protein n=1 Tax=Streptomyces sp. NPDC101150 TaxID=3366114 RepID=UPI003802D10E